jgi:hypothetical protein
VQGAQIIAVERENVEGIELHALVMPTRVQRLEIRDPC